MPGRKKTPEERIAILEARIEKRQEYIRKCEEEVRQMQAEIEEIRKPKVKVTMRSVLAMAKQAGYTPEQVMEQLQLSIEDPPSSEGA